MGFVIPKKIKNLTDKFDQAGAEIYIVGGAVRDILIGREIWDWDLATNLTPEEMKKLFPKNSFCNNVFGTFSVLGKDGEIFEITTYRTERDYLDARHPDKVEWGKTIEEDLKRRDFTVNAMALDPAGKLIDLYGGQEDIKKKLIRAVGDPDLRFSEDALRMMRAVRIAIYIGFEIEEKTLKSIQKNAAKIKLIAGERIRDESFKILQSPAPAVGIKMLLESGLLAEIIPELTEGIEVKQKGHHIDDVWNHNLKTLAHCVSTNPVTRLACLLHDVAKPAVMKGEGEARTFHGHEVVGARIAVRIGKRLKLSNKELDLLFRLVRWHMFTVSEVQTDAAVRRFIRNVTPEYIEEMIALRRGDRLGSGAKETSWRWEAFRERIVEVQKQPFSVKDMKVDGHDVMEVLGIKPGPKVGEILNKIFAEVEVKPELNEREVLLEKIKML